VVVVRPAIIIIHTLFGSWYETGGRCLVGPRVGEVCDRVTFDEGWGHGPTRRPRSQWTDRCRSRRSRRHNRRRPGFRHWDQVVGVVDAQILTAALLKFIGGSETAIDYPSNDVIIDLLLRQMTTFNVHTPIYNKITRWSHCWWRQIGRIHTSISYDTPSQQNHIKIIYNILEELPFKKCVEDRYRRGSISLTITRSAEKHSD